MEFLFFLIIAIYLFSFTGVILLLIQTSKQSKEIKLLSRQLKDFALSLKLKESENAVEHSIKLEQLVGTEQSIKIEQPVETEQSIKVEQPVEIVQPTKIEQPVEIDTAAQVEFEDKPAAGAVPDEQAPVLTKEIERSAVKALPSKALLLTKLKKFLHGKNLWASGGVILLTVAFGMLISFLASRGLFTVEMGISAAALSGLFMVISGWRLRSRRPVFFLLLQGGGIGILYLSVFAAYRFTSYFPVFISLFLLTVLVIPAVVLAVFQNSQILAVMGFLGGFAAPLLLSPVLFTLSPDINHLYFFSFYLVLNLAVLFIGFRRLWNWLNLLAFLCTFISLIFWVVNQYDRSLFLTVQLYYVVVIIIFTTIGIRSLSFNNSKLSENIFHKLFIIAGTPLVGLIIQWNLVSHIPHGRPVSCIAFSIYYLALIRIIWKKYGNTIRPIAEAYLALAVLLANMAIPLELSRDITGAVWAAEAVVLLILGLRLSNRQIKIWAFILHLAGSIAFIAGSGRADYSLKAFLSPQFLGSVIIAMSALVMVFLLNHFTSKKGIVQKILTTWALIWLLGGSLFELVRITNYKYAFYGIKEPGGLFLISCSLAVIIFYGLSRSFRYQWLNIAIFPSLISTIILVLGIMFQQFAGFIYKNEKFLIYNFFHHEYIIGWLLFFVVHAVLIVLFHRKNTKELLKPKLHTAWLFTVILTALPVLTASGRYLTVYLKLAYSWTSLAGILPSLIMLLGLTWFLYSNKEIINIHGKLLFLVLPVILSIILGLWFLLTLFMPGDPRPLPLYIPFINPLDLQQGFCIAGITLCLFQTRKAKVKPKDKVFALTDLMVFLWINAIIARCVHFYAGVLFSSMMKSPEFHLGIFIFWALFGIAHILIGHRKSLRPVWIAGAVIVIIDIAKLLLFDLADTGTLSRVVSFFIAGVILLLIGWAAPLPPSRLKETYER